MFQRCNYTPSYKCYDTKPRSKYCWDRVQILLETESDMFKNQQILLSFHVIDDI